MQNMRLWMLGAALMVLAGCGEKAPEGEITGDVDALYNQGMNELNSKDYADAIHTFEELERQHPYSSWATRAQLMAAFAQFERGSYEAALVDLDRFIQLHPGHKDLPYVYYLKGLSHYNRISDVARDQGYTRQALNAFEELVARYPNSEYAQDARLKITLCKDHLAAKEMAVGRYYLEQGRHVAAINRFKTVLKDYETSTQTPEALYRLTETYLALGLNDEAQKAASVLGYNFQGSDWYQKAYDLLTEKNLAPVGEEKSWAGQLMKGIKEMF